MATSKQKDKARDYTRVTIRRLDILSGNECAHPDCTKKFIAEDGISIVSKICHIAAASEDGPRFDKSMSDDERRSFENLILLCDEHHVMIDNKQNEDKYTTELLKKWKSDHETKIRELTASKNLLSQHPLALNKVINLIGRKMDEILDLPDADNAPNPVEKIAYNNVVRYEPIVREFAAYQGKLNKIYEEIEKEGSTKKDLVLYNIKRLYYEVKKAYPTIEDIRNNADNIFDKVIERIWNNMENAPNKIDEFDYETVDFSLMIIVVDAFMRCNILEEPPKTVQA